MQSNFAIKSAGIIDVYTYKCLIPMKATGASSVRSPVAFSLLALGLKSKNRPYGRF